MNNIKELFKVNFKQNKNYVFLVLFLTVTLIGGYVASGNAYGSVSVESVKIGIMDYDNSELSQCFKDYLTELKFDLVSTGSLKEMQEALIDKEISVIIEVPEGLLEKSLQDKELHNIQMTSLDDYENKAFTESYINIFMSSIDRLLQASKYDESQFSRLLKEFNKEQIKLVQTDGYQFNLEEGKAKEGVSLTLGFYAMIVSLISFLVAFSISEERTQRVYDRVKLSPVSSVSYLTGKSLFAFILGAFVSASFVIFLVIGKYPIGLSPFILLGIMLIYHLIWVGISIIFGMIMKSPIALATVVLIAGNVSCILGGAFFPIDMMPDYMSRIAKLTPTYWMMHAIKGLLENKELNVSINFVMLSLMALLSFLIAGVLYVRKSESKE